MFFVQFSKYLFVTFDSLIIIIIIIIIIVAVVVHVVVVGLLRTDS